MLTNVAMRQLREAWGEIDIQLLNTAAEYSTIYSTIYSSYKITQLNYAYRYRIEVE